MAIARLPTGEAVAVPDRCPHAGVELSGGFVEDGQLVCPMHGWRFDLATGRCVHRPDMTLDVSRLGERQPRLKAVTGQQILDLFADE